MAITPFYREKGTMYPGTYGVLMPGQNFKEHELYALRTRIENHPTYAAYANKYHTNIGYKNIHAPDRIYIGIQIHRVGESNPDTNYQRDEVIDPIWLQTVVDECLNSHYNYAVILSDKYEIRNVPSWWLAEILPRIDITDIIQRMWFPDNEANASDYDFFYENGNIYLQLISSKEFIGPYTPQKDDIMNTGEKPLKRGEASYGDDSDFHERYIRLHTELYYYVTALYQRGIMCLQNKETLIRTWKLVPYMDGVDLYEPLWEDFRLTGNGGICKLLQRQLPEYENQWDAKHVYLHVGENRVLKHLVAAYHYKKTSEIASFYDTYLALKVNSLEEAQTFANKIEEFKDTVSGSVLPKGYVTGKVQHIMAVYYAELTAMRLVESKALEITLEIIPKTVQAKDVRRYLLQTIAEPQKVLPKETRMAILV